MDPELESELSDFVETTFALGPNFGDEVGESVADFVGVRVFVTRLTVIGLLGAWLPELVLSSDSKIKKACNVLALTEIHYLL